MRALAARPYHPGAATGRLRRAQAAPSRRPLAGGDRDRRRRIKTFIDPEGRSVATLGAEREADGTDGLILSDLILEAHHEDRHQRARALLAAEVVSEPRKYAQSVGSWKYCPSRSRFGSLQFTVLVASSAGARIRHLWWRKRAAGNTCWTRRCSAAPRIPVWSGAALINRETRPCAARRRRRRHAGRLLRADRPATPDRQPSPRAARSAPHDPAARADDGGRFQRHRHRSRR